MIVGENKLNGRNNEKKKERDLIAKSTPPQKYLPLHEDM